MHKSQNKYPVYLSILLIFLVTCSIDTNVDPNSVTIKYKDNIFIPFGAATAGPMYLVGNDALSSHENITGTGEPEDPYVIRDLIMELNNSSNINNAATDKETIQEKNIRIANKMQILVDRLKDIMNSPHRKKIFIVRFALYIVQLVLIIIVCSLIPNIWISLLVSGIIAFFTTMGINIILKKMEVKEHVGEINTDVMRNVAQQIISSFPIMPLFIQNNIMTIVFQAEKVKRKKELYALKRFKRTMELYILARKYFRNNMIPEAQKTIKIVIKKAQQEGYYEMLKEAESFLNDIEIKSMI